MSKITNMPTMDKDMESTFKTYSDLDGYFISNILTYSNKNNNATNIVEQLESIYEMYYYIHQNFQIYYNSLSQEEKIAEKPLFDWIVEKADSIINELCIENDAPKDLVEKTEEILIATRRLIDFNQLGCDNYEPISVGHLIDLQFMNNFPTRKSERLARKKSVNYAESDVDNDNNSDSSYEPSDVGNEEVHEDEVQEEAQKEVQEEVQEEAEEEVQEEEDEEDNKILEEILREVRSVPAQYKRQFNPEVTILILFTDLLIILCLLMLMECFNSKNNKKPYVIDCQNPFCENE